MLATIHYSYCKIINIIQILHCRDLTTNDSAAIGGIRSNIGIKNGDLSPATMSSGPNRRWKGVRWMTWNPAVTKAIDDIKAHSVDVFDKYAAPMKYEADCHADSRKCQLCSLVGDDVSDGCGRLLNYDAARLALSTVILLSPVTLLSTYSWVHVNCAIWSCEVYENVTGGLMQVDCAVSRGRSQQCSVCHQPGATARCYRLRCENHYHFPCARRIGCYFLKDKVILIFVLLFWRGIRTLSLSTKQSNVILTFRRTFSVPITRLYRMVPLLSR